MTRPIRIHTADSYPGAEAAVAALVGQLNLQAQAQFHRSIAFGIPVLIAVTATLPPVITWAVSAQHSRLSGLLLSLVGVAAVAVAVAAVVSARRQFDPAVAVGDVLAAMEHPNGAAGIAYGLQPAAEDSKYSGIEVAHLLTVVTICAELAASAVATSTLILTGT